MLRRRARALRWQSAISAAMPMIPLRRWKKHDEISEDDLKDAEEKIQKITDKIIEKIDKAVENKTKEIYCTVIR